MANIRPNALPDETNPSPSDVVIIDGLTTRKTTLERVVNAGRPNASQAEAEAGVDSTKGMTPLTTKQAIQAQGDIRFASAAQGGKADSAVQSVGGGSGISVNSADPQNPVISYTGAGVSDGDKGDVVVSSAGTAWQVKNKRMSNVAAAIADNPAADPEFYDIAYYDTNYAPKSGATYRRVGSEPTHLGKFQNANGTWYELDATVVTPQMFGYANGANLTPYMAACVDIQRPITLPKRAGGYVATTGFSKVLTAELLVDWQGQKVAFSHQQTWEFKGLSVLTGVLPSTSRTRYQTQVFMASVSGIQSGDIFYMNNPNQAPLMGWSDTKKECVLVTNVDSGAGRVDLAAGLNFNWTLSASDNFIDIWRPQKVTFIRPNIHLASPVFGQAHFAIHFLGLRDIQLISPRITAPLNIDRRNDIYRIGVQVWKCWNLTVTDLYTEGMAYPVGVYGGTRNVFEYRTRGHYCHHANIDCGDFASDYILDGFHASDCYMALNTHPCFRAYANNFDVQNDFDISNWRCIGGRVTNGRIQTLATDADASAQFQSEAPAAGFEYLYGDADFDGFALQFIAPNRSVKSPFEVGRGRVVTLGRIVTPVMAVFTSATNIQQLIVGDGVVVGGTIRPRGIFLSGAVQGETPYTMTWTGATTNPSIGNGAILSTYTRDGNRVKITIRINIGSTTTLGSGVWSFSLPFNAINTAEIGDAVALDNGTGFRSGSCVVHQSSPGSLRIISDGSVDYWGPSIPITWATGDEIKLSIIYTAAS